MVSPNRFSCFLYWFVYKYSNLKTNQKDFMIVVDVEATWLDTQKCSILSIGAVNFFDIQEQFYDECDPRDWAFIQQEALKINWFDLWEKNNSQKLSEAELIQKFTSWLGKFSFKIIWWQHPMALDIPLMKAACDRAGVDFKFPYKTVDLHSLWYDYVIKNWLKIPLKPDGTSDISLDSIGMWLGIGEEPHPHNALTGAKFTAECLSRLIYSKPLGLFNC